jgi:hypothetical protein
MHATGISSCMSLLSHPARLGHPNNTGRTAEQLWNCSLFNFFHPLVTSTLISFSYSPQHPVLYVTVLGSRPYKTSGRL